MRRVLLVVVIAALGLGGWGLALFHLRKSKLPQHTLGQSVWFAVFKPAYVPGGYVDLGEESTEIFRFASRAFDYAVIPTGEGEAARYSESKTFKLKVESNAHITRMYYSQYNDDLLLLYELTDTESGWGRIVRLDGKTLQAKWDADIPGFNLGEAVIEGSCAYLTAIGFIAKLDLVSGSYIWRQGDLYEKYPAFNDFDPPRISDDIAIFKESEPVLPFGRPRKVIKVDRRTGEILAVTDLVASDK